MKKLLLLLALAATRAASADTNPFTHLTSTDSEHYAAAANRLEYQNMVLLPEYPITARHYHLAPAGSWLERVREGDAAAQHWQGKRQYISGQRPNDDRIELWTNENGTRAAALLMSSESVDAQNNHLLVWLELAPTQGRQDSEATMQAMLQAIAREDSARMAALLRVPAKNLGRYRDALQHCLQAHLAQITDAHAIRADGDRARAISITLHDEDGEHSATLPLEKTADGYAFILDTDAFSHCRKLSRR